MHYSAKQYGVFFLGLILVFVGLFQNIFVQAQTTCPSAPPSRMIVGEQGVVGPGGANNMRSLPSASGERVGQIPASGRFIVLEGPVCADGFAWWRVDYNGLIGWTAEGQGADYWIDPAGALPTQAATVTGIPSATPVAPEAVACPGFLPSRLIVGEQGRVVPGPANNLRAEPASGTELLAEMGGGGTFLVLEGPLCSAGLAWWRVDYRGTVGWTAEGSNDVYWLEPAGPIPTQAPTLTPTITNTPRPTNTPMPTNTPIPAMPPLQTFPDLETLQGQAIPSDLAPITADNLHRLEPLAFWGDYRPLDTLISPNGELVAVNTAIGVWIYTMRDLSLPPVFLDTGYAEAPQLLFSPDSRLLVVTSRNYAQFVMATVQFWDMTTMQLRPIFQTFTLPVDQMVFSPDSRTLYTSIRSRFDVWALTIARDSASPIPVEINREGAYMAVSPDGSLLAVSGTYGTISIYNLQTRTHQINYEVDGSLGNLVFSPNGSYLMSAGGGGSARTPGVLRIWDVATSRRVETPQFEQNLMDIIISQDERYALLVASNFTQAWVWDIANNRVLSEMMLPSDITSLALTPDNQILISERHGKIALVNRDNSESTILLDSPVATAGVISGDGSLIALTYADSPFIRVWNTQTAELVGTFETGTSTPNIQFDPSANILYVQSDNNGYAWNLTTGTQEPRNVNINAISTRPESLIREARSYTPPREVWDVRQAITLHNSSIMVVNNHSIMFTFWDTTTRSPLATYRFIGDLVGFNTEGTLLLTHSQGQSWLWGVRR